MGTHFIFLAGEFSLQSDGSSTNTSAANTPDSGDALDESTDSGVASMGSGSGMAYHLYIVLELQHHSKWETVTLIVNKFPKLRVCAVSGTSIVVLCCGDLFCSVLFCYQSAYGEELPVSDMSLCHSKYSKSVIRFVDWCTLMPMMGSQQITRTLIFSPTSMQQFDEVLQCSCFSNDMKYMCVV